MFHESLSWSSLEATQYFYYTYKHSQITESVEFENQIIEWSLCFFFFNEPVHKVDWTTLTELTGLFKIQQSPHWIIDLVNTLDRMIQLSDLFNNQRSSHIDSLNRLAWFTNWCVQPRGHDVGGGRDDGFVQTLRIANCRPDLM